MQIPAIASLSSPQFNANPFLSASAPFPKFVNRCGNLSHELRKRKGTGKKMISRAADRFEVPGKSLRQSMQKLQIGGAGGNVPDVQAFFRRDRPMAPVPLLCESGGYSNHVCLMQPTCLAMRH